MQRKLVVIVVVMVVVMVVVIVVVMVVITRWQRVRRKAQGAKKGERARKEGLGRMTGGSEVRSRSSRSSWLVLAGSLFVGSW